MKNECLIIAGGEENSLASFYPSGFNSVYVIACDKGYEYASKQGIPVDFVCGDFDSCSLEIPSSSDVPDGVDVLPSHKDDTDLIHGIKHALLMQFSKITVACAGGGRYDHFLSNIQALVYAKEKSSGPVEIRLVDDRNEVFILKNESGLFPKRKDCSLSVLSFTDKSEGVSISGAEYEVSDVELLNTFPLGQSNSWKSDSVQVIVEKGILLVIISKLIL